MVQYWRWGLVALALSVVPAAADASRVSPMIVDLSPAGQASIARVELTNDDSTSMPVEVQMMRGTISPEGNLSLAPADDQFLVFPAQALVAGSSQQVFRVQYVGAPDLAKSEIYYMAIRELPVAVSGQQSAVQVVINYNVLVNVVPAGTRPDPVVRSAVVAEQDGKPGLAVDVGNDGSRYFLAGASRWSITGKTATGADFTKTYDRDDLTKEIGVGVVTPAGDRKFFIPTDSKLADGTAAIKITP